VLGVAAGVLLESVGPELVKSVGPTARSVLKFFFRVGDNLGRSAARTWEKVEDFVAETRAEYDAEQEAAAREAEEPPVSEV